jgi:squalene-associated FAD-dependent desaturase
MKLAIIGAGWAGMAAAVAASQAGHQVTVFEAARTLGGRARGVPGQLPDGTPVQLDNGQHILIGAYSQSLKLMRLVGIDPVQALLELPMTLRFPDGLGLRFNHWPTPLDAFAGIVQARGWSLYDKWSLLRAAAGWRIRGFQCAESASVAQLCQALSPRVMTELIEPLCVSALNTPAPRASASVFLRVMQDALFGAQGGSRLLLPRVDLSALFPLAAQQWIQQRGAEVRLGARLDSLRPLDTSWQIGTETFDQIVMATPVADAIRLLGNSRSQASESVAAAFTRWCQCAEQLRFEAITTVYAWAPTASLSQAMLTLRSTADSQAPAQFVFDRGQLGGPRGLLAFVVSASATERELLQAQVLNQARQQLGLNLQVIQTIVEKRATFACTPCLIRPDMQIAPGLLACGDYVAGPYPATLEGAVRSGLNAVAAIRPASP